MWAKQRAISIYMWRKGTFVVGECRKHSNHKGYGEVVDALIEAARLAQGVTKGGCSSLLHIALREAWQPCRVVVYEAQVTLGCEHYILRLYVAMGPLPTQHIECKALEARHKVVVVRLSIAKESVKGDSLNPWRSHNIDILNPTAETIYGHLALVERIAIYRQGIVAMSRIALQGTENPCHLTTTHHSIITYKDVFRGNMLWCYRSKGGNARTKRV